MAGGTSQYAQKATLDWVFGGATPTRPSARAMGLSLGVPTSVSGSEMSVSAYARKTAVFGAAGTPTTSGTAAIATAITFTVSSACTIVGFQLWDTVLSANSGNMLAWGTLSASSIMVAGDTLSFAIGSVLVTMR